jgi:hypothetical protein
MPPALAVVVGREEEERRGVLGAMGARGEEREGGREGNGEGERMGEGRGKRGKVVEEVQEGKDGRRLCAFTTNFWPTMAEIGFLLSRRLPFKPHPPPPFKG